MNNVFKITATLLLAMVIVTGCDAPDSKKKKETSRLVVIAMDFTASTSAKEGEKKATIREKEINAVYEMINCFRGGDEIFLFQITDQSFSNPKKIIDLKIPHPGTLETEGQVQAKFRRIFGDRLKAQYTDLKDLKYQSTDISGFLLYVAKEFKGLEYDEKWLVIISDGVETTQYLNPDLIISSKTDELMQDFKRRNYICNLKSWKVVRTGLWQDVDVQLMNLYDRFWEKYFEGSGASYQNLGFEPISSSCKKWFK